MAEQPKLTLVESLKQSIEFEEQNKNTVVDLAIERIDRRNLSAHEVTAEQLLKIVLKDVEKLGNVSKCYITLVSEDADSLTVSNYRSGLSRCEEVAFRQLGLQEAMDNWRYGPDGGNE